jgi:hypothetical protein
MSRHASNAAGQQDREVSGINFVRGIKLLDSSTNIAFETASRLNSSQEAGVRPAGRIRPNGTALFL